MKNLKKAILVGAIISMSSSLDAYEPSVYGAGDINSAEPYGLTETEQTILNNKRTLQRLFNRVNEQQRKIDGLLSIMDGQSKEIVELKERVTRYERDNKQKEDADKSYALMLEMGKMIDKINNTYVTEEQLNKVLERDKSEEKNDKASSLGSKSRSDQEEDDASDIYKEGIQLFSRRSYNDAKEYFQKALASGYKEAASNYYLGEIAYYTSDYETAVSYFKKSTSLDDKASYMPILYLHTATSLIENNERDQANSFFEYIIDNYPNTRAAMIAKERIK